MTDALPLLVVVPLFAALFPVALGYLWNDAGWATAAITAVVHLGLAGVVAQQVLTGGQFSYAVGGFQPPIGIELVADSVTAVLVILISSITILIVGYTRRVGPHQNAFYSELLLLTAGVSGVVITGDLFNLYVFLEITGLATYALVAANRSPAAALASVKYLLVGTIGASLYLLGVGYLYVATGTLNMADLATQLPAVGYDTPLVVTGFILLMTGLAIKTALFPVHTWQPNAYAKSPHSVTAYIAALVSTAAAYAIFRIIYTVFTPSFASVVPLALDVLAWVAAVSIIVGSVLAVVQSDLKRMLAYSSVAQFGLIIAGIAVMNQIALTGSVVHLVGHAVMKAGLFVAVGGLASVAGGQTIDDMIGLGRRAPVVSLGFATLAFALVGVPPAIGFAGKWQIVLGAVSAGHWAVGVVAVVSTMLTLAYFLRVVERLYFRSPSSVDEQTSDMSMNMTTDGGDTLVASSITTTTRIIVTLSAISAIGLGLAASDLITILEPAVEVYF